MDKDQLAVDISGNSGDLYLQFATISPQRHNIQLAKQLSDLTR